MATININYGVVEECTNRISLIVSKIDDIARTFENKASQVIDAPYWNSKAASNYKKNCEFILNNLSSAIDNLNNYRESLYKVSASYSKIENSIKDNGYNL